MAAITAAALPSWAAGPTLKIRHHLRVSPLLLSHLACGMLMAGRDRALFDVDDSARVANETPSFITPLLFIAGRYLSILTWQGQLP